jgi:lactoylglutathione lyase
VASVDSFLQKLVKAGIEYHNAQGIKNEITIRPDDVKQIYFTDPDGYWIEINDSK